MIAALPMYDWPETRGNIHQLWQHFAANLSASGVSTPTALTRSDNLPALWLAENLLLAQTCTYPMETILKGKVKYIATPSYKVKGCEMPGFYRSVIIKNGTQAHAELPDLAEAKLPDFKSGDIMAVNGMDSMSGYHSLVRDCKTDGRRLPERLLITGSHRQSIIAVANGRAAFAAIDCVTWDMACRYEMAAKQVYIAGWTQPRPGLPLITSLTTDEKTLTILKTLAFEFFDAVALKSPMSL